LLSGAARSSAPADQAFALVRGRGGACASTFAFSAPHHPLPRHSGVHRRGALIRRAEEAGFTALAARLHDFDGTFRARAGDTEGATAACSRAGEHMRHLLSGMGEADRRAFIHHPQWRGVIGRLLDAHASRPP
jgi:hypothetical protein